MAFLNEAKRSSIAALYRKPMPVLTTEDTEDAGSKQSRDPLHCRAATSLRYNEVMDDRFASFRNATAEALLNGTGATPAELRQAIARGSAPPELMSLVQKIRSRAYTVTDEDLDRLRSRYSEDALFEIIVAAAFGVAQEQLAAARRALEDA